MDRITLILQSLREAGLTQSEIARRTGIPQPRLSRWARGGAPATANDALILASFFSETVGTVSERTEEAAA